MRSRGLVLALLVGVALVATGWQTNWKRLPIDGPRLSLNDQVGYVSVARHWVDEGRLDSSLIYPSLLGQTARRNSLYMPGYYAELALSYRLLGYSAITSRFPAIASFVFACGLVYWIARRLYGEDAALYSGALFAFFPLNLIYGFTAMAEMPLVAAGLAAFALFLLAREEVRWWVGPIALALPMLFRETGIAFGVVMCVLLLFSGTGESGRKAVLCGLLACIVLVLLLVSPAGAGRPSMWKANVLARGSNEALYSDAFAVDGLPHSAQDWMRSIGAKFKTNVGALLLGREVANGWREGTAMLFLLSGIPLGLWLWARKRDAFALGVVTALSLLLAADLCLYIVWYYRGVRSLLLLQPLIAMLWGVVVDDWTRQRGWILRGLPVLLFFFVGVVAAGSVVLEEGQVDSQAKEDTAFLESVVAGDRRMLVSPYKLSLDYVNEHYPQRWAFPPANCSTMKLLDVRWRIGVLIMPAQPGGVVERGLCGTGLELEGERVWRGTRYWVFRGGLSSTESRLPSEKQNP
jgi:hypothetical protein